MLSTPTISAASSTRPPINQLLMLIVAYTALYFLASYLDLFTTALALQREGTSEGNVYANDEEGYSSAKAWQITVIGALLILGCMIYALTQASKVSPYWLQHPIESFKHFYVLFWARKHLAYPPSIC